MKAPKTTLIRLGVRVLALSAISIGMSCGDDDPHLDCGPGTKELDGACVPVSTLNCGAGTIDDGSGNCVPSNALVCGSGTVDDGSGNCVPSNALVCGSGTEDDGAGTCVPIPPTVLASDWIPPGPDWPTSPTHTITLVESGGAYSFQTTAALTFQQGQPYIVRITNTDPNGKHYFTAPDFYRAVAWRKAQTRHAEYKAPYFDAFELLIDGQIDLYFVPVRPGKYAALCTIGNHNESGMHIDLTITGDMDVAVDHELEPSWDPELGLDWRRGSSNGSIWKDASGNALHTDVGPIVMIENGDGTYDFEGVPFTLTAGQPYKIRIENPSANASKHYFTATGLYATSVWRKAQDGDAEIKAPYLRAVELVTGNTDRFTELYIVPTVAGSYDVICTVGDHQAQGMDETITVQ